MSLENNYADKARRKLERARRKAMLGKIRIQKKGRDTPTFLGGWMMPVKKEDAR